MAETSSYDVELQAAFYGFDTTLFLNSLLSELLFGDEGVDIDAGVKNDNASVL